ncbi:MAG: outer membrane beta-barrel protein [Chitinophagaceae bacterium]|nr:outer membrane beta-barrel protein [Chitinophagaceae bacterium]
MSNNAHIDKIFKEGLGEISNPNRDAMWQKMEGMIDNDAKKKKRRFAFIILFGCLVTAGFFIAVNLNTAPKYLAKTKAVPSSKVSNSAVKEDEIVSVTPALIATSSNPASARPSKLVSAKRPVINYGSGSMVISNTNAEESTTMIPSAQQIADDFLAKKMTVDAELLPVQYLKEPSFVITPVVQKTNISTKPAETKKEPGTSKKISIEAIAGGDFLRMNRKAGYYAGIRINRLLDKGTVISVGFNYSSNTVNDRYYLSSKPEGRRETDARVNDIRTLRVPVYFQRQLANSKFALMAGLIPTYVIDATVYNVPNSFNSDPNQFRKFTLKDINRFNILFGAGIKYSPLKRVAFELSGSYGFTTLVKNSYINKSRVNDNFKSIQAGVVFKLR